MNILISGAGTAGLSLAYWLKSYGFSPTIVESAPTLRLGGYKIDVRGEALQTLHRAGIYDTASRLGFLAQPTCCNLPLEIPPS